MNHKIGHEFAVKAVTLILFIVGMAYIGYASELMKGTIPEGHRFIISIVFIYGSYRLSQEIPLLIYKMLFLRNKKPIQ